MTSLIDQFAGISEIAFVALHQNLRIEKSSLFQVLLIWVCVHYMYVDF